MIKENKYNQYGFLRSLNDIRGITIHETDNYNMNAQQIFDYLDNESKDSECCHYICDDEQTIQVMPNDWAVYHTKKGKDYGCKYTIAIQICSSINDEKFKMAKNRAIELIKELMQTYNISPDDIFFHNDFNSICYCPNTLLRKYGSSKRFVLEEIL